MSSGRTWPLLGFYFFWKSFYLSVVVNIYIFFKWQHFKNWFCSDSQPHAVLTLQMFKPMCTLCVYRACDINKHFGIFKSIFRPCSWSQWNFLCVCNCTWVNWFWSSEDCWCILVLSLNVSKLHKSYRKRGCTPANYNHLCSDLYL